MIQRVLLFLFLLSTFQRISSQTNDSVYSIKGVEISADRISVFASGLKIQNIDSTTLALRNAVSLATILSEQSSMNLRSYGPGGISTLSLRGTNSSQSGVFWNGINLNQPNIGQTDLSRISTFDFNDISIQSGSASALLGSGIIGGSLHLSNHLKFSSPVKTSVLFSGATSGNLMSGIKMGAGSSHLAYSGSLSGNWNQNNFWYTPFSGDRKQLEHALVKSISTIHQAEYILNSKQHLTAGLWFQETNRQIPPTMTMNNSDQQQWDQAIRSSLNWSYSGEKQSFNIKTAFITESEHYQSANSNIDALYYLNTFQTEFDYKRFLGNQITIGSGTSAHLIRADIPYYQGIKYQFEGSVWLAMAYISSEKGIKSVLNLRQDFTTGFTVPFCPSISAEIPVSKQIVTHFSLSRNFRIPSMNDRFWFPGGNPDLKPESSWNFEAGTSFQLITGKIIKSKISIDFYNLLINNLIQWVPGNSNIWSPQNVQKVWSRGVELTSKSDWKLAGFAGYLKFGYNYTPSTYNGNVMGQENLFNKQLIYMPLHKVVETIHIKKGSYFTSFTYSRTGKRFVQSDNEQFLPEYSLLDFYVGITSKISRINFRFQAEMHNILDNNYQSVLYYPEPGRTFSFNILISNQ